jgi:hypothetical protein
MVEETPKTAESPIPIERLKKTLTQLQGTTERTNFENLWQTAAEFCKPNKSDIKQTATKGERKVPKRITDKCIEALRGFVKGMFSYAVGTGKFYTMQSLDPELKDDREALEWFEGVVRTMDEELRSNSNFEEQVMQNFEELGYIGTGLTSSEWHDGGLNFRTMQIENYWFALTARQKLDKVYTRQMLTAEQIDQEFFAEEMGNPFAKPGICNSGANDYEDTEHVVIRATCRNPKFKMGSIIPEEKRFISVYYLDEQNEVFSIDGHDSFPFHLSRLYSNDSESHGRSCFMDCEKTASLLNDERLTLIRGGKNRADPPWVEAADSRVRHIRTNEIHKVIYDPTSLGGPPQQMDIRSDVGITEALIKSDEDLIDRAFYIKSFNPLIGEKNMSATETIERMQLSLSETTPMIYKWYRDYLTSLLRRAFELLERKGKFEDPPSTLKGTKIGFVFVSKAAMALKQLDTLGMMNNFEKAKAISELLPEILDNYDPDKMAAIAGESDNVMGTIMRKPKEVKAIRAARAAAQKQQKDIEAANMIAQTANQAGMTGAPGPQQ